MGQGHSYLNIRFSDIQNTWKKHEEPHDTGLKIFCKKVSNTDKVIFLIFVTPSEDDRNGIKININHQFLPRNKVEYFDILECKLQFKIDKKVNDSPVYEFFLVAVLNLSFPNGDVHFHKTGSSSETSLPFNFFKNASFQDMATATNRNLVLSGGDFSPDKPYFIKRNCTNEKLNHIYAFTHVLAFHSVFFRDLIKSIPDGIQIPVNARALVSYNSKRLTSRTTLNSNSVFSLILDSCSHEALNIIITFLHTKKIPFYDLRDASAQIWLEILHLSFKWQIKELQRPALLCCYSNISAATARILLDYSLQLNNAKELNLLINDYIRVNWDEIPKADN